MINGIILRRGFRVTRDQQNETMRDRDSIMQLPVDGLPAFLSRFRYAEI